MTVYNGLPYTFTTGPKGEITATRGGPMNKRGQAISNDGGKTFQPHGSVPIPPNEMPEVADAYENAAPGRVISSTSTTNYEAENVAETGEEMDKILDPPKGDPTKLN